MKGSMHARHMNAGDCPLVTRVFDPAWADLRPCPGSGVRPRDFEALGFFPVENPLEMARRSFDISTIVIESTGRARFSRYGIDLVSDATEGSQA